MQSSNFKKACVIGWPIAHSRSPLIHNFWLKKYKISGSYEKVAVSPDDLVSFVQQLLYNSFCGCNVTIPHKEQVFQVVTILDSVTRKIGAVNTVYCEQGRLFGLNTDGYGFLSNLQSTISDWDSKEKTAVIIGAGGASRAIIAVLLKDGIGKIILVNRTLSRAQNLANEFGPAIEVRAMANIESCLAEADLLINTTALGMTGQPPLKFSFKNLNLDCIVTDIVYVPLETQLLKQAKLNGHRTVDGLGMLLHQAVPGFEKWFGIKPEVTSQLRELIVTDLMKDLT